MVGRQQVNNNQVVGRQQQRHGGRLALAGSALSEGERHENEGRARDGLALAAGSTTPTAYVLSAGVEAQDLFDGRNGLQ